MIAEVLLAWLATYALHSTLLLGTAWVLAQAARRVDVRDALWKLAAVGPLLSATLHVGLGLAQGGTEASPLDWRTMSWLPPSPGTMDPALDARFWIAAWAAGACLGLGVRERRRRTFWRGMAGRRPVTDPELTLPLQALSARLGVRRAVRLTASERLRVPAAVGRAEICVPDPAFWRLSPAQRESVLAHEVAHLRRADPLWRAAFELLAVIFFFQPLHRVAAARLHETAEFACDEHTVVLTGHRRSLVESLAVFATGLTSRPSGAVSHLGGQPSPLLARVQRVLDPRTGRPLDALPRRAAVVGGACAVLAVAVFGPGVAAPLGAFDREEEVAFRGVSFDAEGRIERIAPDGFVVVAAGGPLGERRLQLGPAPDGTPHLHYSVNGKPARFGEGARRWAARTND